MKTHKHSRRLLAASVLTMLVGASGGAAIANGGPEVIAEGLNNPRQLAFTPGGTLYVAEAGTAGDEHCQVHPELGPMCLGLTGSLAKIGVEGEVDRVLSGLPSIGSETDVLGPGDIVFTGNHQFALTIGLGASPAFRTNFGPDGAMLGTLVSGDLRHLDGPGSLTQVADILGLEASENWDGTDIDSNPVGVARSGNGYVVADAGANAVVSTRKGGSAVGVLDPVPTTQPTTLPFPPFSLPAGFPADAVPTDVVMGPDGAWYVSQLVGFPFEPGSSKIWRIVPGSAPQAYASGLTNVTSLAFAEDGSLYAVQIAANGLLNGPVGSLVKITPGASTHTTVAGDLFAPYGVAIRGSSAYVTTCSVCAGGGTVIKVAL